jgi:CRP/FNR family transcriptional regulator
LTWVKKVDFLKKRLFGLGKRRAAGCGFSDQPSILLFSNHRLALYKPPGGGQALAKSIVGILAEAPIFNGLGGAELDQIRAIAVDRYYDRGRAVFFEGDPGDGFYAVVEGKVKIYKLSPEGKEKILHIYGPGQPFGEVPVFAGKRFPANAQTLAKSHLLFFPRAGFIRLITENPSLALNMLAVLSGRLRQFTLQIESLALKEVPARLASYLVYLAKEQGASEAVTLDISKGQLASLLGTIPETLSRIFSRMSGVGLIEVDGKRIALLDREGLKALADQEYRLE